jgi:PKD repeat protein
MDRTSLIFLTIGLFLLGGQVQANAVQVQFQPALYVTDFGSGQAHSINSYTLLPDRDISSGAWMLLGTNDQTTFARIDSRKDILFLAGGADQFYVANSDSFRWYYLYLQDGFPVGTNVELHLEELSPAPTPTAQETESIAIVIERVPLVIIADLGGNPKKLHDYTFTSSKDLPGVQSWQVYGTNNPDMLGSDDPGLFTLLDNRSGISFTSGVLQQFNVSGSAKYLYYLIYLQSGFAARGMTLEIGFHEPETVPTPTPTETPAPTPSPTVTPSPTPTPPPLVDFEGSPRAGYAPLSVSFTDKSPGTISTWSWDFGDGNTSSDENPVHTYDAGGLFSVNLTICNDGGCTWLNRSNYIYAVPLGSATPSETPRYYIKIGGGSTGISSTGSGSTGSSSAGSSTGTTGVSESGAGEAQGAGSTGTSSGSGTSQSNGVQGSQGTGGTAGHVNGMPNHDQAQPSSVTGIQALIQAIVDTGTTAGAVIESVVNQLLHLLGI